MVIFISLRKIYTQTHTHNNANNEKEATNFKESSEEEYEAGLKGRKGGKKKKNM